MAGIRPSKTKININNLQEIGGGLSELLSDLVNKNAVQSSVVENTTDDHNPYNWVDIVEFCESPYYLGLSPYPWQKLILKLFYMGSDGNRHLSICDKESGCRNCVWNKSFKNLRGYSPCLKCNEYNQIECSENIQEIKAKWWLSPEEIEEIESIEKVNLFLNEKQLIEKDLIEDSDSVDGGSVKKQVLNKIGNVFSELLLVLGRRSGKAEHIDTPIITTDGWKTMEEIKIGDYVFGPDGFPTKVIAMTDIMYDRPCYEITFSNNEKIKCDALHEWLVQNREPKRDGFFIRTTEQISKSSFKNGHKYKIRITEPLKFEEKELPLHPYLLGYYLGDGNTDCPRICINDDEVYEYLISLGYDISKYDDLHYYVKGIKDILRNINVLGNKHIPDIYMMGSIEQRMELLQGLLDSDGACVQGKIVFSNTNKILINQTKELMISLGLNPGEQKSYYNHETFKDSWQVCCSYSSEKLFKIARKYNKQKTVYKREPSSKYVYINSCEKIDSVPMKCIQVDNASHQYLCGKSMIPTHNSMLVSIIALYESYKLIEMGNPQVIFGNLNEGDTICILNVAVSEQQAKESVFDKIKPMITNSAYFRAKISPSSLQNRSVRFLTPRDIEINEELINEGLPAREGSIYLLSGHSNSDSLVGKNVLVVIIDEMASMVGKDGSKMSDEELYTKLKHSIWTFGRSGKIVCISNPLTKDGKFFELYEQSFSDGRMLMVQLPSYKVNPTLNKKALDAERDAAQKAGQYEQYFMQIEARFSGGAADPFIPAEFIDAAFEKGSSRRRTEVGDPNTLYYMHLDPANNSDNYALAIVHIDNDIYNLDQDGKPKKVVIVDHINMWQPSETGEPVEISEVDQYVIDMTRHFNIVSITYDMWESAASSQLLQRMGLPARVTHFNSSYKQQIYSTLRNAFYEQRIEFYKLDGYDSTRLKDTYGFVTEAIDQFKFLGRKFNKKSFSVQAAAGHYDDIPDCIAGASFIALTGQHGYVTLPRIGSVRMPIFR